jgi:hypothetical protein
MFLWSSSLTEELSKVHAQIHAHTHSYTLQNSLNVTWQFKSRVHSTEVSTIHICEPEPGKTKSVTHARILLVRVALTDSCRGSHFSYRLASGKLKRVTGKCFMCVCHCADNWKNLTPDHSVPSMLTGTIWAFIIIHVFNSYTINAERNELEVGYQMGLWLGKRSVKLT